MDVYQTNYGNQTLKWPYPVNYEKENVIVSDILIIGAGVSGGMAAVTAARSGLSVAVVDKAPIARSGSGGAGIDHWNGCPENPCSPMNAEEYIEGMDIPALSPDHLTYITAKENYDALLELEEMGLPIRDEEGEFEGAEFRDPETKLLFAYDYVNKIDIKLRGGDKLKVVMNDQLRKMPNVQRFERIMITSLLTEGGKQGTRVIGATGISLCTGEFYIFKAKSVVLTTGCPSGIWIFNTELCGGAAEFCDPNDVGDGYAMAWNAGAQITLMSRGGKIHGGGAFAWPVYGVGNCDNTWFPCSLVDANGKEVPWEDINGNPVTSVEARNHPVEGQPYITTSLARKKGIDKPRIIRDFHERVRSGEYQLPLYAALPGMPEKERRSIWGIMIGNEGKTRFAVHDHYAEAGFNPDTDMLQVPMMNPESYGYGNFFGWYHGESNVCRNWRDTGLFRGSGGLVLDWNLMSNLPGLFSGGIQAITGGASSAAATGRYAARNAVAFAKQHDLVEIDAAQLEKEKNRVYAPVKRVGQPEAYIGWKELWAGMTRVMQCHCGEFKTKPSLEYGLNWLKSIRDNEMQQTYARNPHELARVLECESRMTVSEMFLIGCIGKIDADESGIKDTFIVDQMCEGKLKTTYLENKFWLKPPYASSYLENYKKYANLYSEQKEA